MKDNNLNDFDSALKTRFVNEIIAIAWFFAISWLGLSLVEALSK